MGEFPETYMIGRHDDFFVAAPAYWERSESGFTVGSLKDTFHRALCSLQGAADAYHELRVEGRPPSGCSRR